MKKLVSIAVILLLLTGCNSKNNVNNGGNEQGNTNNDVVEQKMTCTLHTNDVVNEYTLDATYVVTYKNDLVYNVESTEIIKSDSSKVIDYFNDYVTNTYTKMNESYGGYTYSVNKTSQGLTSKAFIDYEQVNIKKLVEDQPTMKSYVKDNKITKEGIKAMYTQMGATCN